METPFVELIAEIARTGAKNPAAPPLWSVEPLRKFFLGAGQVDAAALERRDGACTGREVLARFLVLNAVLDQGPDLEGVRQLLSRVTNELYLREVRFLHRPVSFFQELGIGIDHILETHESLKQLRAESWAKVNMSNPARYNLFTDNATQALGYAVYRWGVPLALPLLLEKDARDDETRAEALVRYLEDYPSAERMSQGLKDDGRYGLGKAIGDKACHLFAKWYVSSFALARRSGAGWGAFSFEVPFDSNAGRVLWRTGFLLSWATEKDYVACDVIQRGKGKGGTHYIRVTNIRGKRIDAKKLPPQLWESYVEICREHLRSHAKSPTTAEIQRLPHAILLRAYPASGLGAANLDDGLIHIGTRFCFNHSNPHCSACPVSQKCLGYQQRPELIEKYRT